MSIDLILKAAKYIEYTEAAQARGEECVDIDAYFALQPVLIKPKFFDQESSNSSWDSEIAQNPNVSYSSDGKFRFFRNTEGLGHKEVHNRLEKNRRAVMKMHSQRLKSLLPNMTDKKVSKQSLLEKTKELVVGLKLEYSKLSKELHKLNKRNRRLKRTVMRLEGKKKEGSGNRNSEKFVSYEDHGETTTTASECGDSSSDETIVDQMQEVKVGGNKTNHMSGTPGRSISVPTSDGKHESDGVCTSYEQGSILFARLSEGTGDSCKDVHCESSSTLQKPKSMPKESPGKNACLPYKSSGLNVKLDCDEKSLLSVQKKLATIKTNVPFTFRKTCESKSEVPSNTSASLGEEVPPSGAEITLNALREQSHQTDAITNYTKKELFRKHKLMLNNMDFVPVHSNSEFNTNSGPTESQNNLTASELHETVIKPPSSRTIKLLFSPLDSPTVIQKSNESLLKSIPTASQLHVAFRTAASCANNCAQKTLKSSDDKSFGSVSQVDSAVPVYLVSTAAAGTGLQLPSSTINKPCSPVNVLYPVHSLSHSEEHCSQALPNLVAWHPNSKFYVKNVKKKCEEILH